MTVNTHHCYSPISLDDEIRRFWEVEELPCQVALHPQDAQCEAHFRMSHSRTPEGRYVVRLPFKAGPPIAIGQSRAMAEKLLNSLTRRFQSHPDQAREYSDFIREYKQLGHMREIRSSLTLDSQHVYIPHHAVVREDSTTTHLRVVFNASSSTTNGSSLNDHLLAGPKLQTELPAVILQWQKSKYVYTADITKMYRQILVDPRDTKYQKILWKERPSDAPKLSFGQAKRIRVAHRYLRNGVRPVPRASRHSTTSHGRRS